MRVTVWGERFLEGESLPGRPAPILYAGYIDEARRIYPDDVHEAIASGLRGLLDEEDVVVTATLDDPGHGLTDEVLDATDVLVWWSHVKHVLVSDEEAERVCRRIIDHGMGLIMLHAGTGSKVFHSLMGTSCGAGGLRQGDDWEALWTVMPSHPIASGIDPVVVIPREEMFCEYFDVPTPDEVVFISTFKGGEVFRSGCCFTRGKGHIFYFRPGHESHPTYHHPAVQQILASAARWACNDTPSRVNLAPRDTQDPDIAKQILKPEGWFLPSPNA